MINDSRFRAIWQQLAEKLKAARSQEEAVELLLQALMALTGAERGSILLKNRATGELEVEAAVAVDPDSSGEALVRQVAQEVAQLRQTILTDNASRDDRFSGSQSIVGYGLRSVAGVPLQVGGEVRGVIYLDQRLLSGSFAQDDLDAVIRFAQEATELIAAIPPQNAQAEAAPPAEEAEEMPRQSQPGAPPSPVAPPAPATPAPSPPPQHSGEALKRDQAAQDDEINFSAYYLREVTPNEWQPLMAYVYKAFAEGAVNEDAGRQLGPLLAGARKLTQAAKGLIREGALITATPTLPGFQFNPPSASAAFFEDWHRFDFKMRAKDAPLHQGANGWITFTVEGIIVGDLPLSVYVGESVQAALTPAASRKLYQAIFCSYSRKDIQIIERVERAYKALGLDYLRDMQSLRSGENWSDGLEALIERADIFQLFWSEPAVASQHVRMEWEYALKLGRTGQNFIRPVYWTNPIPAVPPELKMIHFAYQPDLVE